MRTNSAHVDELIDLLDLDSSLSAQERDLRDVLRQWLSAHADPYLPDWFESGRLPRELARGLGALGVLGMQLDGYGCTGSSALAYGVACRELEASDSGLRSFVSVQGSLVMFAIRRFGSEEHKQRWLPRMATGDAIGCFGLTEPDAGSDPGSMRTRARREGDSWVLTGRKMWITNGDLADVAVIWARTDDGVAGFLVPRGTPGFSTQPIRRKLSLRASVTSELICDECRLPADAQLPEAQGLSAPLACLNEARYGIVWGAVGAARSCAQAALRYALERAQFGRPIAGFQLTQQKLVEMALELGKAQLLALRLAELKDAGRLRPQQVSVGKLNNVRSALTIARTARSILGANGISLEFPVIRHMVNLESVLTYEGTDEVHTLIVGEALTGLSAFR
jgi:glutaryl-CoA dehydrogenase